MPNIFWEALGPAPPPGRPCGSGELPALLHPLKRLFGAGKSQPLVLNGLGDLTHLVARRLHFAVKDLGAGSVANFCGDRFNVARKNCRASTVAFDAPCSEAMRSEVDNRPSF